MKANTLPSTKQRLTKEDWLFAGFRALCDGGPKAIRAEAIARELKTTKGSFYWHFADVPTFEREMLEFWQIKATTELIEALKPLDHNPKAQLYGLIDLMHASFSERYGGFKAEPAIRHWAVYLPAASDALNMVDALRLAWLRERFEKLGQTRNLAETNAANFYALVMGLEQLELQGKAKISQGLSLALDQMLA